MNITITGNLGSGKSSVCKELNKAGFTVVSAGDIFRQIAAEKDMTVIELNEAAKKDRSIDDMLDDRSTKLGKEMDHTVFDSRLAWHFVEDSFKVFLLVETGEAARRVFDGEHRSAEDYQDIEQARRGLEERAGLEQDRFWKLYGIDYYDASNYDLIIESTCATPEQIAQEIQRNFQIYQKERFSAKVELNLRCLHIENMAQINEVEKNQSLCADGSFDVVLQSGGYYLKEGQQHAADAIAEGRIFAEIKDIVFLGENQEKNCGYMVDFSKVFECIN